ncbi:hypothetical protein ACLOJK_033482 [Asimina triloba]
MLEQNRFMECNQGTKWCEQVGVQACGVKGLSEVLDCKAGTHKIQEFSEGSKLELNIDNPSVH